MIEQIDRIINQTNQKNELFVCLIEMKQNNNQQIKCLSLVE
jgi:hypothetical protein